MGVKRASTLCLVWTEVAGESRLLAALILLMLHEVSFVLVLASTRAHELSC